MKKLFDKAKANAIKGGPALTAAPLVMAQPVGGFSRRTTVAGGGNSALNCQVADLQSGEDRGRVWPSDYNIESFLLDDPALAWWMGMGEEHRSGATTRAHILAAAAVLRSRIPESEAQDINIYEDGHSIDDIQRDALGILLRCTLLGYRIPPHSRWLGAPEDRHRTVGLLYQTRGGGHHDVLVDRITDPIGVASGSCASADHDAAAAASSATACGEQGPDMSAAPGKRPRREPPGERPRPYSTR